MAESVLGLTVGSRVIGQAPDRFAGRLLIVRVYELDRFLSDQLLRRVAEDSLDRRALVSDDPVGAEDRDEIGGILDQGAVVPLAVGQVILYLAQLVLAAGDLLDHPDETREPIGRTRRDAV